MESKMEIGTDSRDDSLGLAREVVFSPVADGAVVEQTVRRLGEAIGLGLIEVGERLPPEAELATRLAIAPMTLREALRILREAGYLETRRGRDGGTFVRRSLPQQPAREARRNLARLTVEELSDLMDYRVAVSGAAVELAAERRSDADLVALEGLVEQMAELDAFTPYRRLDHRFHITVASAARSPRLVAAETAIQGDLAKLLRLIPESAEMLHVSNDQHRELLAAIRAGAAAQARAVMETHIRGTGDFLVGLRLGKLG
ncbi:MAG TPA: FCD domain-containing protein [Gaiellaceae bacterium]|nr:FCD domain-containing protein [Gaiellaceae bacterium]